MRLHRFLVPPPLKSGELAIADTALLNQLKNVLRAEVGKSFMLFDGAGNEAEATLTALSRKGAQFEIHEVRKSSAEPTARVTLFASILKGEHFEMVVEKSVEAGVSVIQPILTDRTVKTGLRIERLQKITKEAAEQSGRGLIPEIKSPIPFSEAISEAKNLDSTIFLDPSGAHIRNSPFAIHNSSGLFVGPEGGWTDNELSAAKNANFKICSLGNLVLRAETAAIIASYLATHDLLQ